MKNVETLTAIICSIALATVGCTTSNTLRPESDKAELTALEQGDSVIVTRIDGVEIVLQVINSDQTALRGTDSGGARHTIAWTNIRSVEVRELSPGRTAAAVGGAAAGVYLFMMAITAAAAAAILGGAGG